MRSKFKILCTDLSLMNLPIENEDKNIFVTDIKFKWDTFGQCRNCKGLYKITHYKLPV